MKKLSAVCLTLAVLLSGAPTLAGEPKAKAPAAPRKAEARKLPPPAYLSEELVMLLQQRMARHGQDLLDLLLAVTLLQRGAARDLAEHIAREPRLARPVPGGESDVNSALPEKFFVLQDQLRIRAQEVAKAAAAKDDPALAASFTRLTETCIACHTAYLEGPRS